jgi:hypothetical protein
MVVSLWDNWSLAVFMGSVFASSDGNALNSG